MTTAIPPTPTFASRRDFLSRSWNGVGALALAGMAADIARADGDFTNP